MLGARGRNEDDGSNEASKVTFLPRVARRRVVLLADSPVASVLATVTAEAGETAFEEEMLDALLTDLGRAASLR